MAWGPLGSFTLRPATLVMMVVFCIPPMRAPSTDCFPTCHGSRLSRPQRWRGALCTLGLLAAPAWAADLVLPIHFSEYATPRVEIELQGKPHVLTLDTGSAQGLHLTREVLADLSGVQFSQETQRSTDMSGQVQENARFTIDALPLGDFLFRNIPGVVFSPWGLTVDAAAELPQDPVMGLGFFAGHRIVLDYSTQTLTVLAPESTFTPSAAAHWVEVPFLQTDEGLSLPVRIQGETHLLSLDSGATLSFVLAERLSDTRAARPCDSIYEGMPATDCHLMPITTEFGAAPQTLYAYVMAQPLPQFNNTGLLGGDFLQQHAIYLDFVTQRLFVRPIPQPRD